MSNWQQHLKQGLATPAALLDYLELPKTGGSLGAHQAFKTRVPRPFADLMRKGDPNDPLLRQVLPIDAELLDVPGFESDPLGEQTAAAPGVLHKYVSRALFIFRGGCAVNCRYCFRREFPYADLSFSQKQQTQALAYLRENPQINEVILSGGDPLMADNLAIDDLVQALAEIPHLKRIRVHSRLPVVIPDRLDEGLLRALTGTRLRSVLVLHSNHPNEISTDLANRLAPFVAQMAVLNQAVLLTEVNDDPKTLRDLSEALFDARIQPYYLFLLDRVTGAAHFEVPEDRASKIYADLQGLLPGFLVPKLAREIPDRVAKTLLL